MTRSHGSGGFAVVLLIGGVLSVPAPRESSGPPPARTGGFGEQTCAECHIGNDINAFGGRVTLEGLPAAYEPGREYMVTAVLEAEGTEVAGFQVATRFSEGGAAAGRLEPVDGRTTVRDSAGVTYLQHTEEGSGPFGSDRASWSFAWTAPSRSGSVAWHVAANSGNGDQSPLGDLVFVAERTIEADR